MVCLPMVHGWMSTIVVKSRSSRLCMIEQADETPIEFTSAVPPTIQESMYAYESVNGNTVVTQSNNQDRPTTTNNNESKKDNPINKHWTFLQTLAAITGRGEFATDTQKAALARVVHAIESTTATRPDIPFTQSPMLQGRWELLMTNTHLFRGSPFFLAGRATFSTPEQAQQYDWFCTMHRQALAISTIRNVRQIVTPTRIVSEFEVSAGAVPFLSDLTPFRYSGGAPVSITGAIVSAADWRPYNATHMELYMDQVQIKGSNIPGLRQLLDLPQVQLPSRRLSEVLENLPGYVAPKPLVRITYLDEQFRIQRDVDDNIYVYVKTSEITALTDYSHIDADLGFLKLLQGFNDAITKAYI
jgi:hypothetical protein